MDKMDGKRILQGPLFEALSIIRLRPGMFLGGEEVRTLSAFIIGYETARSDLGQPGMSEEEEQLFAGFQSWLKQKFSEERTTLGWESIVEEQFLKAPTTSEYRRARSPADGSAVLFFRLFDDYLDGMNLSLEDGHEVLRRRPSGRTWGGVGDQRVG
jgi:hypothetical protein